MKGAIVAKSNPIGCPRFVLGKNLGGGNAIQGAGGIGMQNPGTPEQLAAYMFIVNPVVCPKCLVRYPKGTKVCSVCGKKIPQKDD